MTPNGTVASESDRRDHLKVRSWLIDGEVVCCDEAVARASCAAAATRAVAFLIPRPARAGRRDLRPEPLEVRKATLVSILRKTGPAYA